VTIRSWKRRGVHATAVVACCLVLLEVVSAGKAFLARSTALQMLKAVDQFRLGVTTKAEVDTHLREVGLAPENEGCGAPVGFSCDGTGVVLTNYPQLPRGYTAALMDLVARAIFIFRPTYLVGNFYFNSDRLTSAAVTFSTNKATVGTQFASGDEGRNEFPLWRPKDRLEDKRRFGLVDPAQQGRTSLGSADLFDVRCMVSLRGCNTVQDLWPSISKYRTN
jgi:hypothetical protein